MQSVKVFSDWTSLLFISKYTPCIQRWAGKLLSCSARPKKLSLAPSEVEVAQFCCKNHSKSRPSVLPKPCSALQRNSLLSGASCAAWHPPPGAPKRAMALYHSVPCHVCQSHRRCQGQPIVVIAAMVSTPEEQHTSTPQPQAARRAWLCPPLLPASPLSFQ